jgi:hypothetical protein
MGNYKLSPYLDAAYKANPNQFEKTLLRRTRKLDGISAKRKNFKIFPILMMRITNGFLH